MDDSQETENELQTLFWSLRILDMLIGFKSAGPDYLLTNSVNSVPFLTFDT